LNVLAPTLVSVQVLPTKTAGGEPATGTITLSSVTAAKTTIAVVSNSAVAKIVGTVVVPAGQSTGTFTVDTTPVAANVAVTVTATLTGISSSCTFTVKIPALAAVSFEPPTVNGGANASLIVTLASPAPTGGTTIAITYDANGTELVKDPTSLVVPAGGTGASTIVSTKAVTNLTAVTVNGNLNTTNIQAKLSVKP
jgi:hypothetical protein